MMRNACAACDFYLRENVITIMDGLGCPYPNFLIPMCPRSSYGNRYEGQRDMLFNQTFNLDQVAFAAEGIKDAQQTVCFRKLFPQFNFCSTIS